MIQNVKRPSKKIVARTLDWVGIDHSIWLEERAFEYQISRRIRRDFDLAKSINLSAPPKILLIADSTGSYAQILNGILGWGLWLRGVPNQCIVCDGGLPVCDAKKITYPDIACADCFGRTHSLLDAFQLPYIRPGNWDSRAKIARAWERVQNLDARACAEFTYRDLPLGAFARISLASYLLDGNFEANAAHLLTYRQFLASGMVMADFYTELFDTLHPEKLLLLNGLYLGWRVAWALAQQRNIPVVTWEVGFHPNTIVMAHDEVACYFDNSAPWQTAHDQELTADERKRIETYLGERRRGNQGLIQYTGTEQTEQDALRAKLEIPADAEVYALFTNVEWDSAVVDRHRAFGSQLEWLQATVRYFAQHPELYLVLRVHPGELAIPMMETRDPIAAQLARVFPTLPPNVRLVDGSEKLNSYALLETSRAALVYTSTIGLEAACMGKPVIVAGLTHYADKGFTLDVSDAESFAGVLNRTRAPESASDKRELALRYAYLFFFRTMLPHDTLLRADRLFCVTDFPFRSLRDLAPGQNAQLDLLCDVILNKRKPLLS